MNKKLTLAIDVNTILNKNDPEDGLIRTDAIHYIRRLYQDGHYIIITSGLNMSDNVIIIDLLKKDRVTYHLFNANSPTHIEFHKEDPRKIVADVYIDAKSLTYVPLEWRDMYKIIISKWQQ